MPKPKKKKQNALQKHAKTLLASLFVVVILAVAYLVVTRNKRTVDAHLTAPPGTTARSAQIDESELTGESGIDESYDTAHQQAVSSDSAIVAGIGEAVRDAN